MIELPTLEQARKLVREIGPLDESSMVDAVWAVSAINKSTESTLDDLLECLKLGGYPAEIAAVGLYVRTGRPRPKEVARSFSMCHEDWSHYLREHFINGHRCVNVLGVGVSVLNLTTALDAITRAVVERRKGYVCVTGVHGVSEAQEDPEFRRILNRAFLNTPDGMPMVWLGRRAGHREMGRVYGPDLMTLVMRESAARGWRHFFYGGANGTAERLRTVLTEKYPGLQITGTYEPPFRPLNDTEQAALTTQVAAAKPDMFWVGLSTPKQERFMAANLARLDTTLMFGVGAAFDMLAGTKAQAPRWMQRSGLEWFYRLCQEPRRLGPRYLKNNPLFALRVLGQLSRLRKYELNQ